MYFNKEYQNPLMWYSSTALISSTGENHDNDMTLCLLGLLSAEEGTVVTSEGAVQNSLSCRSS